MRMEKNRFICLIFILFFFTMPVFSQILSPVSGKWSNRQLLVIDVPAGSTAFYSINGESPEKSGFAYDGPVLIDLDGEVVVNVSIIDKNGNSELRKISYTVTDDKLPLDSDSAEFIKQIKKLELLITLQVINLLFQKCLNTVLEKILRYLLLVQNCL